MVLTELQTPFVIYICLSYLRENIHLNAKIWKPEALSLQPLNQDETFGNVKYLTIIARNTKSDSCPDKGDSDNVICVYLDGAENYYYDNNASEYSLNSSLHTALVHPNVQEVYNKIVEFIKK